MKKRRNNMPYIAICKQQVTFIGWKERVPRDAHLQNWFKDKSSLKGFAD